MDMDIIDNHWRQVTLQLSGTLRGAEALGPL